MATVPHVTSGLGLRKFQADGFLLTRVYNRNCLFLLPWWWRPEASPKHYMPTDHTQDNNCHSTHRLEVFKRCRTHMTTDSCGGGHKIPRVLWKPNIPYHSHKSSPLVPTLSQIISVHTIQFYSFHTHFNIILSPTRISWKWSYYSRFSYQNSVCIYVIPHTCHMARPSYSLCIC